MDSNGGTPKRVELPDGGWADVRRVNGAVMREAAMKRHARGFEDATLDTLDVLPMVIAEWHKGLFSEADVASLDELSITRIWMAAKGLDVPNLSSPSPNGSEETKTKGNRRSSGVSV